MKYIYAMYSETYRNFLENQSVRQLALAALHENIRSENLRE